jgi:hypothetical protein
MSYESLVHLSKLEIDALVELFLEVNALRKKGYFLTSRQEVPDSLSELRETLEIKEGESMKLIHEVATLIEEFSRLKKGEGQELISELPESSQGIIKKGLVRLSKSKAFINYKVYNFYLILLIRWSFTC